MPSRVTASRTRVSASSRAAMSSVRCSATSRPTPSWTSCWVGAVQAQQVVLEQPGHLVVEAAQQDRVAPPARPDQLGHEREHLLDRLAAAARAGSDR